MRSRPSSSTTVRMLSDLPPRATTWPSERRVWFDDATTSRCVVSSFGGYPPSVATLGRGHELRSAVDRADVGVARVARPRSVEEHLRDRPRAMSGEPGTPSAPDRMVEAQAATTSRVERHRAQWSSTSPSSRRPAVGSCSRSPPATCGLADTMPIHCVRAATCLIRRRRRTARRWRARSSVSHRRQPDHVAARGREELLARRIGEAYRMDQS
jgi:hypothetical protein